jgi:hypothetical protein
LLLFLFLLLLLFLLLFLLLLLPAGPRRALRGRLQVGLRRDRGPDRQEGAQRVHDHVALVAPVAEQVGREELGVERDELAQRERQPALLVLLVVGQQHGLGQDRVAAARHVIAHGRRDAPRAAHVDLRRRALAGVLDDAHQAVEGLLGQHLVGGQDREQVELAVLVLDQDAQAQLVQLRALRPRPLVLARVAGAPAAGRALLAAGPGQGGRGGIAPRAPARGRLRVGLQVLVDLHQHGLDRLVHQPQGLLVARDARVRGGRDRDLEHDQHQHEQHQQRQHQRGAAPGGLGALQAARTAGEGHAGPGTREQAASSPAGRGEPGPGG